MTYLDCTVTGCIYNEDKCCSKGNIEVEGAGAKEPRGTCCGSFRERGSESSSNVAKRVSKEIEVDCEAKSCVFNEDCKCSAQHIGIAGSNACTCGETECASFSCCRE